MALPLPVAPQSTAGTEEPVLVADYLPGVRGHAVLATGHDTGEREALAVWRSGPTGVPSGAWVFHLESVRKDPEPLRKVMRLLTGCCLVAWTEESAIATVSAVADLLPDGLAEQLISSVALLPDLLDEIAGQRRRCAAAVEEHRLVTKSKLVPLAWHGELTEDALRPRRIPSATPVAAAALSLAGSLRRAVELWQDTEQTRCRRSYLRALGEQQALPPRWLAHLRATASGHTL